MMVKIHQTMLKWKQLWPNQSYSMKQVGPSDSVNQLSLGTRRGLEGLQPLVCLVVDKYDIVSLTVTIGITNSR